MTSTGASHLTAAFDTLAVRAGRDDLTALGVHALPIDLSTTNPLPDIDAGGESYEAIATGGHPTEGGNVYARLWNPTVARFEQALATLEGADEAVAFASGMAAFSATLLAAMNRGRGRHIVAVRPLYGGTDHLLASGLLGAETTFCAPDEVGDAVRADTCLVVMETPCNPTLELVDIAAVAAAAGEVPVMVDSTFATPVLQNPLAHGAALVLHSATKYLGGHGTTLAGVIVESGKFPWDNGKFPGMTEPSPGYHGVKFYETFGDFGFTMRARMETLRVYGAALAPTSAWQILQGIETLPVRMERHCANALRVAEFLRADPRVGWVSYPGLPEHPQHALEQRQMRGASGLLAFGVKGGVAAGVRFIESAQFMSHLANIGDTRTLIIHPASTTHRQLDDAQQLAAGVLPDMVRMSVGLEHVDDILWDIDQALAAASA